MVQSFILLFVLSCSVVSAQDSAWWEWQNPKPQGTNYHDVAMLDSATYFAIGDGGLVVRTTDNGETWDMKFLPTNRNRSLNAIAFSPNRTHGITIGDYGEIFLTTDQGGSWTKQANELTTPLLDVCYASEQVAFAVGTLGVILRSEDTGRSWQRLPIELTDNMLGICFSDHKHGFISAQNGIFYVTSSGGSQWQRKEFTYPNSLHTIDIADMRHAITGGEAGGVFLSNDSGNSWQRQQANILYVVRSAVRLDQQRAVVCGDYYQFALTTDGGATWSHPLTDNRRDHLRALAFADDRHGVCVGTNGLILRTTDGGLTWYAAFENIADKETLRDVHCFDTMTAVAIGTTVVRTTDRGKNWTRIEIPTSQILRAVDFPTPTTGYIVGDSGVILRSTDAGLSWQMLQAPFTENLYVVDFLDQDRGILTGGTAKDTFRLAAQTLDGGNSWKVSRHVSMAHESGAAYLTPTTILIGGGGLRSSDGGITWKSVLAGTGVTCFDFVDSLHGFAGGLNYSVTLGMIPTVGSTSDGGLTWTTETLEIPGEIKAISAADRLRATAVGGKGNALHTVDGGKTWKRVETNTRGTIFGIDHPASQTATAVGFRALILRLTTTDQPLADVNHPLPSSETIIRSIYPNPAVYQTTIDFELTAPDVLSIALYSLEGKLTKRLFWGRADQGKHSLEADLNGLATGSYTLAVTGSRTREHHTIVIRK